MDWKTQTPNSVWAGVGRPRLGRLKVASRSASHLGCGEVEEPQCANGLVRVAFYGGPDTRSVHDLPTSDLCHVILARETRAFCQRDAGVIYGRVIACADESSMPRKYYVQFQGERDLALLDETQFRVKATGVPSDPVSSLRVLAVESPYLYCLRSALLRDLLAMRETTHGFDGITSSKVNFYAHQVQIARHVLSDVRIRYLLADEVGLGKTIETGMILRQILLDTPGTRAAVFAPSGLVRQWQTELRDRFDLEAVQVHPHESLSSPASLSHLDLLVIDEAHHLLACVDDGGQESEIYRNVQNASTGIPHVLLLSATPVLHRERELLALLNLLEPTAFPLDRVADFRELVANRQEIGRCLLALTTASKAFSQRRHLCSLAALLPTDPVLSQLSGRIQQASAEEVAELARHGIAHVSETYRLYRRMLRTRRDWLVSDLGFSGRRVIREPDEYCLAEDDMAALWRLLEDLRIEIQSQCRTGVVGRPVAQAAYFDLANALSTEVAALLQIVPRLLGQFGDTGDSVLRRMSSLAAQLTGEGMDRPDLLREVLVNRANRDSALRYVVFCSDASMPAIEAALAADPHLEGVYAVVGRSSGESQHLGAILAGEDLLFLVAGQAMEEGANLQDLDGIIFYDLPWSPMRMEQRVGRLDRIIRTAHIRCTSLLSAEDDMAVDGVWLRVLEEGFGLFSRSLSDLQFLVERELPRLRDVLFDGGPDYLSQEIAPLRESMAQERQSLDEQDVIDGIRHRADEAVAFRDRLAHGDALAEPFARSFLDFVRDGLRLRWSPIAGIEPQRDGVVPLVPLSLITDVVNSSRGCNTFRREEVVSAPGGTGLIRPGHPMVSVCEGFLRNDDRGRAFALYRVQPGVPRDTPVFRVDVVTGLDVGSVAERLSGSSWEEQSRAGLLRLVRGWISDFLTEVFLLEDGTRPSDELVQACVAPYDKASGDTNLGKERVAFITERFGQPDWPGLVSRIAQTALDLAVSSQATQNRFAEARKASEGFFARRRAILQAMSNRGDRQAAGACAEVEELSNLVGDVLSSPRVVVDSIGLYYISPVEMQQNWGGFR